MDLSRPPAAAAGQRRDGDDDRGTARVRGGGPGNRGRTDDTAVAAGRAGAACGRRGVLRVGMEPDAPPLHFINDRKQEDGFDFRLAGVVAEGVGAKRVQVVEADYEDLPERLRAGEIDLIMAGYVPDPSIDGVVWSNGYLDFGLCMIVHEGMVVDVPLAGRPRRQAHRHLRRPGRRALGAATTFPNARISKFSGDDGWFEAVERDQADALIYDYPFAAEEIKAHPRTVIVQVQPQSVEVRRRHSQGQLRPDLRGEPRDRPVQGRRRSTPT